MPLNIGKVRLCIHFFVLRTLSICGQSIFELAALYQVYYLILAMDESFYMALRLIPTIVLGYAPAILATIFFFLPVFLPSEMASKRLMTYMYEFHKACISFVGYAFRFVEHKDDDSGDDLFIIFGYIAPKAFQPFLCLMIFTLWMTSSVVFLERFVMITSTLSHCPLEADNSLYACFPASENLSLDSPLDCSDTFYLESNNFTSFRCYEFVFDYAEAAGDATGTLAISGSIMSFTIWAILKISGGKRSSNTCSDLKSLIILALQGCGPIIVATIVVTIIVIPDSRDVLLSDTTDIMNFISLCFTLVLPIFTPWYKFTKVKERKGSRRVAA